MSQNKRKQHSAQFKAKVALEAIKGERANTFREAKLTQKLRVIAACIRR